MDIQVKLTVDGQTIKTETIHIDDTKLEELSDEEVANAIEINIRSWVDRSVQVEWEVEE